MSDTHRVWYRIEDRRCAVSGFDDDDWGSVLEVSLFKFKVLKETPRGAWLDFGCGAKRFARIDARKRYACPTFEEAKASFRARKERQIAIYQSRITDAKSALYKMETLKP